MTALSIQPTYPIFTDIDGQPLEAGYIWIGTANLNPLTNPISVYWDAALTQPAAQPIRTVGGYPVNSGTPARLYVNSDYSIQVQNRNGSVVYSAPAATERLSDVVIDGLTISSADVSFLQAGASAVTRTAQSKMRESVSVLDFGAVCDGVTDDATAVNAAITAVAALGGGDVFFPAGTTLVGATIGVADNVHLRGAGQKATTIKLKASSNVNIIEQKAGSTGLGMGLFDLTVDGNQTNNTQGGVYLVGVADQRGPSWQIERVRITKCRNSVMGSGVKAAFFIGGNTWHVIRDLEIIGNDFAQIAYWHGAADSNVDGVYLGTNGYNFGSTAYGLFVTSAGNFFNNCYFGGSQPGPQIWFTGASASANKFVNCIVDNAGKNGVTFVDSASNNQFSNCQIGNSSYSDGGTYYLVENGVPNGRNMFVGVKFYSDYATAPATHAYYESPGVNGAAQLIGCEFSGTYVTSAVQIPTTSTTQFVGCKGYDTTNVGTLKASTKLDVVGAYPSGAPATSSVPLGRFNGGGAISLWASTYAYQYTWLQGIQDDGSNSVKPIYLNPLGGPVVVGLTGHALRPNSDNAQTLGTASERWSVVYAGTGTINTSDEREKQDIADLEAAEKRVALALKGLIKKFRFKDAVEAKGDGARIHVGVIAQEVMAAFQAEALDPMRYGVVCYDEWEATEERSAGNRYGVRYEELFAFIISAL